MNVAIKDGGVALTVQLGTGKLDTAIKPSGVRFDDNRWHSVNVTRIAAEVSWIFFNDTFFVGIFISLSLYIYCPNVYYIM